MWVREKATKRGQIQAIGGLSPQELQGNGKRVCENRKKKGNRREMGGSGRVYEEEDENPGRRSGDFGIRGWVAQADKMGGVVLRRSRYSLGRTARVWELESGKWNGTDFGFVIMNRVGIWRRYMGATGLVSRLLSSTYYAYNSEFS